MICNGDKPFESACRKPCYVDGACSNLGGIEGSKSRAVADNLVSSDRACGSDVAFGRQGDVVRSLIGNRDRLAVYDAVDLEVRSRSSALGAYGEGTLSEIVQGAYVYACRADCSARWIDLDCGGEN